MAAAYDLFRSKRRVNVLKKVKVNGIWKFCPAVVEANGKLKDKVRVNGRVEVHPEGVYYLERRDNGQRLREAIRDRSEVLERAYSRALPVDPTDGDATPMAIPAQKGSIVPLPAAKPAMICRRCRMDRHALGLTDQLHFNCIPASSGRSAFAQEYGVLETITKIEPEENACSDGKTTVTVKRKPGASPLLFGEFLMDTCAFLFLEDISDALPPYEESVIQVEMDAPMATAYEWLEEDMREALKAHRGNRSVLSIMLNTLLIYPDHPYGLGKLYGFETDEDGRRQRFLIANPEDLPEEFSYSKERTLVEEVKKELAEGRRCQVFAVYTQKRDVTARLERILRAEGISCAVMRSNIDTSKREAWYERRLREGVQVFIAHPRLVETGLDLLFAPTIIFYESGYSLHTLRQASRRSWRIGQRQPVRVKFLCYEGTMQVNCLRLMGRKLLVALAMEGKFAGEGLQSLDEDDDMLTSMAKELVEKNGIGESADSVWKLFRAPNNFHYPELKVMPSEAPPASENLAPTPINNAVQLPLF